MIYGMILREQSVYNESNDEDFTLNLLMENLEMEGKLFEINESKEEKTNNTRMIKIKEKFNKLLFLISQKINNFIKYISTVDKKNIVYYKSLNKSRTMTIRDGSLYTIKNMINNNISTKEQACEYITNMKYSDINIDFFLDPKSGIDCEGINAYNKYIDSINTLRNSIKETKNMIDEDIKYDNKLDKMGKDLNESILINTTILYLNATLHLFNVILQALNKGLSTARKGIDNNSKEDK